MVYRPQVPEEVRRRLGEGLLFLDSATAAAFVRPPERTAEGDDDVGTGSPKAATLSEENGHALEA